MESTQKRAHYTMVLWSIVLFLAGCNSGTTGISGLRIGDDTGKEVFPGQPLQVTARLATHTEISHIDLEIQPAADSGWTFRQEYRDGYSGLQKVNFKAELPVPPDAEPGTYRLALRLTDKKGSEMTESDDFRLAIDSSIPTATDLDAGINTAGNDLHLETELTAPGRINKVVVDIKGDEWQKTFTFAGKQLTGQLSHRFHEHVDVAEAPKGFYQVILTVEDQKGKRSTVEGAFTK